MARHKAPTKKQILAIDYLSRGASPTEAMRKAGYAQSTLRNPKQTLLKGAGTQTIVELMRGQLLDNDITGIYLANKLTKFINSENPKVFFSAYDRVSKIMGIEPTASQLGQPSRQVTFTEWVTDDNSKPQETEKKEETNNDLLSLESIKLDRFDEPIIQESKSSIEHEEEVIY